jgi:multiple sugar transport system substrate-binding protein
MKAEGRRQKAEGRTKRVLTSALCLLPSAFIWFVLACAEHRDTRTIIEFWGLGREGEVVAEMIPDFERRNPGIKVVMQQIPWIAAHEKLLTAYVGDATPDVAQMGNTWIPEFATVGALDELQWPAADQRDFFPGIWATNVVGGKLYGIPWYVDTRVLFYRKDVLATVGYPRGPRTWSEWIDCMERLQREKKSRYGILMPTNEHEHIEVLAMSNGSPFLKANGTRGAFREPPFRDAFAFYVSLFQRGFAPKVSNTQVANLYQQFAQGEFVMHITGPWNVGEFRRRLPANMQGKWATAPLPARDASAPTGISMAGGASLVIFRGSSRKAEARKFIEFLSEPAQQVRFYELCGDLPPRRSAWRSPALANDPYFPAFRAQLERVAPFPPVPEWEQIATALYEHGEIAVRGVMTTDATLADLDRTSDRILEKRRWVLSRSVQ